MTAADPQVFIRKLIAQETTRAKSSGRQIDAVFIDRPVYDKVIRSFALDPYLYPRGKAIYGVSVCPFDIIVDR